MSDAPVVSESPVKHWWNLTRVEILVVIAIIAVLIAIFLPPAKWAADGSREFPVRVFVFDVSTGQPVPDADVAILSGHGIPGVYTVEDAPAAAKEFVALSEHLDFAPATHKGRTNQHGLATIQAEVRTGSSSQHPQPRAFPTRNWIVVSAPGFLGVVIPLGMDPVLTSELRERGGFLVPIGIVSDIAPAK